jgi:DNA-binding transcriptional LysR family regulator
LSKQVKALELQLGQALVEHGSKPLRLTEAGRVYAEAARLMREQIRNAQSQAFALRKQVGGSLRVTASYLLGHAVLADYVVDLRRRLPQLSVEITLSDVDLDPVADGFDVALRHEQGQAQDLVARSLGANRVRLCGSPAYFSRYGVPRHPDDLASHPCLAFHCEGLDSRWHFHQEGIQHVVAPIGPVSANSDELLLASLRAGEGLLPCFDWVVGRDLQEGRLLTCLDDWTFACEAFGEPELWALYPKGKRGQPKVQLFVDGLVAHLAQLSAGATSSINWMGAAQTD